MISQQHEDYRKRQRQAAWIAVALLALAGNGHAANLYIAPTGSDTTGDGSVGNPYETITKAQSMASAGDTVYLRGGTYYLDNSDITAYVAPRDIVNYITRNGISYMAYSNEVPVFDFSAVQPVGNRVTAFYVTADNCVFEGFEVVGVQITIDDAHTQSECFLIRDGNNNRFERLSMHDGMGIGWYLTRGGNNLVLNCDAYNNKGLNGYSNGNIDGFGAHTDRSSDTGNRFIGCRAWFNSDDGFDLINNDAAVTISNCWSMYNGFDYESPTSKVGDSTGFKAGGYGISGNSYPMPVPRNKVYYCLAVGNTVGFYANHHTGGLDWIGNTAVGNGVNYNMLCNLDAASGSDVPGFDHYMKNNLGYGGSTEVSNLGSTNDNDVTCNYWTLPVTVTAGDFKSLTYSLLTQPRQADGSLPVVDYAHLVDGSDLIDAGTTNVNIPIQYAGSAPDLGAFEYGLTSPPPPVVESPLELSAAADTALRYNAGANNDQNRNYGTNDTLYLRQLDAAPRDYVAYLRFDLASIPSAITNASFTITRSSGDALTGSRFRVLGLDNAAGNTDQDWGETILTYNVLGAEIDTSIYPSPASGDSPFDPAQVTDFESGTPGVTETIVGDTAILSGPALATWLETRRNDGGLATLIIDYPAHGDSSDGNIYYHSREAAAGQPVLTVEFDDGTGPSYNPSINSISVTGTSVAIRWDSDTNGTYRIESKSSLTQAMWNAVSGATNLAGGASNSTVLAAGGFEAEFFRVCGE